MNRSRCALVVLCLAALLLAPGLAIAGKKGGGGTTTGTMTVTPTSVLSPVSASAPLKICVAGFSAGNYVNVNVPLSGDPLRHSWLSYSTYVDGTGGFCFDAPPAGRTLNLAPGSYRITSYWSPSGSSGSLRSGPTATFSVKIL